MVLVEIDLTSFVSAVTARAAKTRMRSVVSPLPIESPIRLDHEGNEVLFPAAHSKLNRGGDKEGLEPAVLANL